MKYYLIAGEASGDLHGANLIAALKHKDSKSEFRGWGGDKMQSQGAQIVKHYKHLAFMGFWEVAKNLRRILSNISYCKKDILVFKPDALILIDYPGFNMRIAKWATNLGITVHYNIMRSVSFFVTFKINIKFWKMDKAILFIKSINYSRPCIRFF